MDEEKEEEAFSYFKHGAIGRSTDRPPRAIHATRLAILAGSSLQLSGSEEGKKVRGTLTPASEAPSLESS